MKRSIVLRTLKIKTSGQLCDGFDRVASGQRLKYRFLLRRFILFKQINTDKLCIIIALCSTKKNQFLAPILCQI